MKKWMIGILLTAGILTADVVKHFPKSYYTIGDVQKRKAEFVKILYPLIIKNEERILRERKKVIAFFDKLEKGEIVTPTEQKEIRKLAKKYRIKDLYDKTAYLKKIDTIPVSLVLAQAAIESGWGRSRFAKVANNLFGEWTWGEKGIVPANREEGKKHKIRIFDSLEDSIASYMANLNRHSAYRKFREARYEARKRGLVFDGFVAANYLDRYSQLGKKYTLMLRKAIARNEFNLLDHPDTPRMVHGGEMALLSRQLNPMN